MNIVRDDDRDPRDEDLQGALRAAFAAPVEESYWAGLERRIMARIQREAAREWWSYFPGWVRVGLAAAAIALFIAGVAAWRTRETQETIAYRELLTPSEGPVLTETFRGDRPNAKTREATLRYLLQH